MTREHEHAAAPDNFLSTPSGQPQDPATLPPRTMTNPMYKHPLNWDYNDVAIWLSSQKFASTLISIFRGECALL